MPYLGISGLDFLKGLVIFEIRALKFKKLRLFVKKLKCISLGSKMPYLGIVGLQF